MRHKSLFPVVFALVGFATLGSAGPSPAAACPYDLLAMLCTAVKNGKCTRWQNCCHVLKASQPQGSGASSPGGSGALAERSGGGSPEILRVAEAGCVNRCNRQSRATAAREACYAGCATAAPPTAQVARLAAQQPPSLLPPTQHPTAGKPSMTQVGSTTATVPMKHGSCGVDCGTHVLAQQTGNLNVSFKLEMSCPDGTPVSHLSYKPAGHNATVVVRTSTGASQYSQTIAAQPFTAAELEARCQQAMGGIWAPPGRHNNTSASVPASIKKSIEVWAQCTGWANQVKTVSPVALSLTCEDQSYFAPVR